MRTRTLRVAALATSLAACAPLTLEYVHNASPANNAPNKLAVAQCPPGKRVTGGGAHVEPQTTPLALIRSTPTSGGSGWIAHALAITPYPDNWTVAATAICANVSP